MLLPVLPAAAQGTVPTMPTAPDWLEPRGLSIVDMVGYVPDEQLRDAILTYETGTGMVQYVSGSRSGNTVVIDAKMTPRYGSTWTEVGCLTQPAVYDQWPTTMPASTMQIFANAQDITSSIEVINYTPAGLSKPAASPDGYLRYGRAGVVWPNGANPARIPANSGCRIVLGGSQTNVTARFTIVATPKVSVKPVGEETFLAHSYIGEGSAGKLQLLVEQMLRRFGTRHDSFKLNIPTGADYMFVKYGPIPFDPYISGSPANYGLPGSGTYRFDLASTNWLSVDTVNSMGIPTRGNWRDADQMGSSEYLSYGPLRSRIKTPEYFLPPGIRFDQCMVDGGCSDDLLQQIYDKTFPVQVYYYQVERLPGAELMRVPLRMVGNGWSATATLADTQPASSFYANGAGMPATAASARAQADAAAVLPAQAEQTTPTYLPIVNKSNPPPPLPPDDPTGCPCGWFDAQGQMYDFIPPR